MSHSIVHGSRRSVLAALWLFVQSLALISSASSASGFSHDDWTRLLGAHVDEEGRMAYRKLQEDAKGLDAYLMRLAEARPDDWDRDAQLAFWINAYNAGIVAAVLQGQSAESLLGRARIFKFWKFAVAGKKRSLDEIEHEILRKRFDEPRIHFAIVCASTSCPRLRREAYVSDRLDAQLEEQALAFINDPQRNQFDRESAQVRLSKIFDWFQDDFEREGTLLSFIARYVEDRRIQSWLLHAGDSIDIDHLDYDWSLNAQPDQRPQKTSRAILRQSSDP